LRIESIAVATPSYCLTNGEILENIFRENDNFASEIVKKYCHDLNRMLTKAQSSTRYIRDRSQGEKALDLIIDAARSAAKQASLSLKDIDLLIFCGVGRGFVEPANASFVCKSLNISCVNFDVSDACMSWVRALHISYNFLANDTYSKIMIVNGEFNWHERVSSTISIIRDINQLEYNFPSYTIGEAAAATILVNSSSQWTFRFEAQPSIADLCTVLLAGYKDFIDDGRYVGINGVDALVSFGKKLTAAAYSGMINFVHEVYDDLSLYDMWFPHTASASICQLAAQRLGIGDKMHWDVFPLYGNLISASVAAAISMAIQQGRLCRGQRIVLCPASAGMSMALVDGLYWQHTCQNQDNCEEDTNA
jgi:acyl-CoA:acyl-CoA alkyltransferase